MPLMKTISNFDFDLINTSCLEYSMVTINVSTMMGKDAH